MATAVCAGLNATSVASQPLRLYSVTRKGQPDVHRSLGPRPVSKQVDRYLRSSPQFISKTAGAKRVEEITEHPLIDLLDSVNPWMDKYQLIEITQLYLEVIGTAYWTFVKGYGGLPSEIWPLPSWRVYVQPDFVGTDVILRYLYTGGAGQVVFETDEILFMKTNNLLDPYSQGWSPLRSGWEYSSVQDKIMDYEDSFLGNRGRPDAVLEPTEDGPIDPYEIQRLSGEFQQQFSRGQAGMVYVVPGGFTLKPLSWNPRDMAEMEMSTSALHSIARQFDVPIPLIEGTTSTRANLDASLLQHARFAVKPRCRRLEECWNSNLVPLYDDRLFLAFDDPVPADQVLERENHVQYTAAGIMTRNEVRVELGLAPVDGGDELLVSNSLVTLDQALEPPKPEIIHAPGGPKPDELPADAEEGAASEQAKPPKPKKDDEPFEEGDDVESNKPAKPSVSGKEGKALGSGRSEDADDDAALLRDARRIIREVTRLLPIEREDGGSPFPGNTKFNPNHDPHTGRFASGHGSGGGGHGGGKERDFGKGGTPEDINDYHQKLTGRAKLNDDEKNVVEIYTSNKFFGVDVYDSINTYHRTGKILDFTPDDINILSRQLDSAISKGSLKEDTVVYRGVKSLSKMGLNPAKLEGATFTDKAYISTSLNPGMTKHFTAGGSFWKRDPAVFRITAPKGTKAIGNAGFTRFPGEAEVLFGRGTKLKITGAKKNSDGIMVVNAGVIN